jgi:hypothetical protein
MAEQDLDELARQSERDHGAGAVDLDALARQSEQDHGVGTGETLERPGPAKPPLPPGLGPGPYEVKGNTPAERSKYLRDNPAVAYKEQQATANDWSNQHPPDTRSAARRFVSGFVSPVVGAADDVRTYITNPKEWVARQAQRAPGGQDGIAPLGLDNQIAHVARGDIAGAFGTTAGNVALGKAIDMGVDGARLLDSHHPAAYVRSKVGGAGIAAERFLRNSAKRNYVSILKPNTGNLVPKAEQIGEELANEPRYPVALTSKGLTEQARAKINEYGPQAGSAYDNTPPVNPAPVFNTIEQLRQKYAVIKGTDVVSDPALNKALNEIQGNLQEMQDRDGNISAASLDDYRGKLFGGNVAATGNMRPVAPASAGHLENGVASSIRDVLDSANPSAQRVNQAFHMWSKVEDFLTAATRRKVAADSNMTTGSSTGAGAMLKSALPRPIRNVFFHATGLFDGVAWNTVSAATKATLADLIASGKMVETEKLLRSLPRQKALPNGPTVTPPPADSSYVRSKSPESGDYGDNSTVRSYEQRQLPAGEQRPPQLLLPEGSQSPIIPPTDFPNDGSSYVRSKNPESGDYGDNSVVRSYEQKQLPAGPQQPPQKRLGPASTFTGDRPGGHPSQRPVTTKRRTLQTPKDPSGIVPMSAQDYIDKYIRP